MSIHQIGFPNFERGLSVATLGSGCFWCSEAVFRQLKGVIGVESGYAGSPYSPAIYSAVCSGKTGLAEVVKIVFDPSVISYSQLLAVFFVTHNPTTLNQQGADVGSQYRSVIFYHDKQQYEQAKCAMHLAAQDWAEPIVTVLAQINYYSRAEEMHQDYFTQNANQGYCLAVILPKLAKLRVNCANLLK